MEDPESEITDVILLLTQAPPAKQLETLNRYFTSTASFTHPIVWTGSWDLGHGYTSRCAISGVYRWYKIMSPKIESRITSVAFDKNNSILYCGVSQTFRIFPLIPLGYRADISLVAKLQLVRDAKDDKFYIQSQEDLYQTTDVGKFAGWGLWWFIRLWQIVAAFFCVLLAFLGTPISWLWDQWGIGDEHPRQSELLWLDEKRSTLKKENGVKSRPKPKTIRLV